MENYELPTPGVLRFLLTSGVSFYVGGFSSLLLTIALLIKWIRRSDWRTLPAFASMIDIAIGTVVLLTHPNMFHSVCEALGIYLPQEFYEYLLTVYFNCMILSNSWSFCLPTAVYKEMTQINKPIHHGKTIMMVLAIGIFVVAKLFTIGFQYCVTTPSFVSYGIVFNVVVLISIIQHLFVIFKVNCNKALLKRDVNHSLTLVKVDLIKQLTTFLATGLMAMYSVSYWLHVAGQFLFCLRLLPLAIATLRYNPAPKEDEVTTKEDVEELKTEV